MHVVKFAYDVRNHVTTSLNKLFCSQHLPITGMHMHTLVTRLFPVATTESHVLLSSTIFLHTFSIHYHAFTTRKTTHGASRHRRRRVATLRRRIRCERGLRHVRTQRRTGTGSAVGLATSEDRGGAACCVQNVSLITRVLWQC